MKQYHDIPKLSFMNETFITQVKQNVKISHTTNNSFKKEYENASARTPRH